MTMISGIVQAVSTKDVTTKFGVKPTYSIQVGGKWIKCGFKNPGVEVGYEVDFDAVTGTYGMETKAVNIISRDAPKAVPTVSVTPATKAAWGGGSYKEKVFPIPALHGDRAIIRQNALARASDIYIAARGGKPFDVEESSLELIIKFARRFEAYTAGDLDLAEAEAEEAFEEVKPSPAF